MTGGLDLSTILPLIERRTSKLHHYRTLRIDVKRLRPPAAESRLAHAACLKCFRKTLNVILPMKYFPGSWLILRRGTDVRAARVS